jgi:transposase InsO family protein
MWHIDTTVIRLLDGTRSYLHAVIDNFSRRILAWRVADVRAREQRGRAARRQSGRHTLRHRPGRHGGCWSREHQWLFLHSLDSVTTVRRLVEFYVDEHNHVLPHSAFRGQTPDEMYFGTGDAVPADLTSGADTARRARAEANRSAACRTCPSLDTAA